MRSPFVIEGTREQKTIERFECGFELTRGVRVRPAKRRRQEPSQPTRLAIEERSSLHAPLWLLILSPPAAGDEKREAPH